MKHRVTNQEKHKNQTVANNAAVFPFSLLLFLDLADAEQEKR